MLDDVFWVLGGFFWLVWGGVWGVNQWIGLGFLQECSGIPEGVTGRGALLMCKFEINHGGLFCSTSTH